MKKYLAIALCVLSFGSSANWSIGELDKNRDLVELVSFAKGSRKVAVVAGKGDGFVLFGFTQLLTSGPSEPTEGELTVNGKKYKGFIMGDSVENKGFTINRRTVFIYEDDALEVIKLLHKGVDLKINNKYTVEAKNFNTIFNKHFGE